MSELFGATIIPLVEPGTGEAVTDPLLSYLLSFFRAIGNTYCLAAWQAVQPGPNSVPIKTVCPWNPMEDGLNENDLPALFLWRDSQAERIDKASDIEITKGSLSLQWVPFPLEQARRRPRTTFAKGLFATLSTYFERGRDPAWYLAGDKYPEDPTRSDAQNAAATQTYGSVLPFYGKYRKLWMGAWSRKKLTIAMMPGAVPKTYESYLVTMPLEEQRYPVDPLYDELKSVDQKIDVPVSADGTQPEYTIVEQISF